MKQNVPWMVLPLVLGCLCGCRGQEDVEGTPSQRIAAWSGPVPIEENDTVINVIPVVFPLPGGGWLVADEEENKVRRYREDGVLLWQRGHSGSGPRETEVAKGAVWLEPNGTIVVADGDGQLVVRDSSGMYERTYSLPLFRLTDIDADPTSPHSVLVTGQPTADSVDGGFIHRVDIRTGSIQASFFDPQPLGPTPALAQTLGYVLVAALGDTVAAAYAPIDSIFFLDSSGARLGAAALPTEDFSVASEPSRAEFGDVRKRAAWLGSFQTISNLGWLDSRTLIVSYKTLTERGAQWHWLAMTPGGRLVHEGGENTRLLTTNAEVGVGLFVHPQAEVPNRWAHMQLRR